MAMIPYDPSAAALVEIFGLIPTWGGFVPPPGNLGTPKHLTDGSWGTGPGSRGFPGSKARKAYNEKQLNQNKNNLIPALEATKYLDTGIVRTETNNHNFTVAAGMNHRVQLCSDFKTNLWTILNTEDDTQPVVTQAKFTWQFYGNTPFLAYIFLVLQEDGESVVNTDQNSNDINAVIEASVNGQDHATRILSFKEAKYVPSYTTNSYVASMEIDISKIIQEYFKYLNKREIEEATTTLQLNLGMVIRGDASTTYYIRGWKYFTGFQQPRGSTLVEALK